MKLSELYWQRITPLHILLWPLSLLFNSFISLRRLGYWLDLFPSVSLPIPVIVVDSMTINDESRTPFILWLIRLLHSQGMRPGIVSHTDTDSPASPMAVTASSDPAVVNGKSLLLAQQCGAICPVWVGHDPVIVAQALLAAHPDCNVLINEGGLQYHRLQRDLEIIVINYSEASFGNGLILPAGPLRESLKYLHNVDAVVINEERKRYADTRGWAPVFNMKLVSDTFYNLLNPDSHAAPAAFMNKRLHAVAGINHYPRFLNQLRRINLNAKPHAFAEHHRFIRQDIQFPDAEAVLMPEEEAAKCVTFADPTLWALSVRASIYGNLQDVIFKSLKKSK